MTLEKMEKQMIDLGGIIKAERLRRNMSQQELADECGFSIQHLINIECGRSDPSLFLLRKMAEAFEAYLIIEFE